MSGGLEEARNPIDGYFAFPGGVGECSAISEKIRERFFHNALDLAGGQAPTVRACVGFA